MISEDSPPKSLFFGPGSLLEENKIPSLFKRRNQANRDSLLTFTMMESYHKRRAELESDGESSVLSAVGEESVTSNPESSRDEIQEVKKLASAETKRVRVLRLIVLSLLILIGASVSTYTYRFLVRDEDDQFVESVSYCFELEPFPTYLFERKPPISHLIVLPFCTDHSRYHPISSSELVQLPSIT